MASNITPGLQQYCALTNPTSLQSITQDVLGSVEAGRTAAASAFTTTASNGDPIPDLTPAPPPP